MVKAPGDDHVEARGAPTLQCEELLRGLRRGIHRTRGLYGVLAKGDLVRFVSAVLLCAAHDEDGRINTLSVPPVSQLV